MIRSLTTKLARRALVGTLVAGSAPGTLTPSAHAFHSGSYSATNSVTCDSRAHTLQVGMIAVNYNPNEPATTYARYDIYNVATQQYPQGTKTATMCLT